MIRQIKCNLEIKDFPIPGIFDIWEIEAFVEVIAEHNYGADADGHRGIYAEFSEGVFIELIWSRRRKRFINPDQLPPSLSVLVESRIDEYFENEYQEVKKKDRWQGKYENAG